MSRSNFVLIVMYDTPMDCAENRQAYRQLFRYLQKGGFYHLQNSIYIRPIKEKSKADHYLIEIARLASERSHIRGLVLTYQTVRTMHTIVGEDTFGEQLVKKQNLVITI